MKRAALFLALATFVPGIAAAEAAPTLKTSQVRLVVALVEDPDFPPLDERLVQKALKYAESQFGERFGVDAPTFEVQYRYSVARFLDTYAVPNDPQCKALYAARYKGGGAAELEPQKARAIAFLEKWSLDSLLGFVPESERTNIKSHADIYKLYEKKYVATVDAMKGLKTPAGTPLVNPGTSAERSFVAWMCALSRQQDFDVILTNGFILADLLSEPHPHAVFGKAKIGGIAARSPARKALGGQALLATTFGIDTKLAEFDELGGKPATFDERAKILGAYLLAHEIAHALYGIPDVFDHPAGCLMTSRPGATYRDGLTELEQNKLPCPKCRPYVEARSYGDRAKEALGAKQWASAVKYFTESMKLLPKQFHGGRKRRMAELTLGAAQAMEAQGKASQAKRYAQLALELDPGSPEAKSYLDALGRPKAMPTLASRTSSTSTSAINR
jgi:hypothetical protein